MTSKGIYKPRWLADKLRTAAEFSPVIVLSGARQTGKSTLLQNEHPFKDWHYITFDDLDALATAQKKPDEILAISHNMVIDEVQKAPKFLHAVKKAVDKDRSRRIVLSGSAKLILMKRVSESLAGRAVYFDLMPFSYGEFMERKYSRWLGSFIETGSLPSLEMKDYASKKKNGDIASILFRGFMPPAALLEKEDHIAAWWRGYIKTYLERDLRDISEISYLPDFRKIMELLALRTANILKQSDVARDTGLSHATTGRYINILEETGLMARVRPYSKNISKRLIKAPKIFITDSGLAAALGGFAAASSIPEAFKGALFESYVFLNLTVIASLIDGDVMYFRTQGGREREVDFVLEKGSKIIGVEVKMSSAVSMKDAENLLFLKDASKRFAGGLVVYSGLEIRQLAANIFAIPWSIF
jgi:predicted AAA+ superfamily ATPase